MPIEKHKYPLDLLKVIEPLLKSFKHLELQNINLIKRVITETPAEPEANNEAQAIKKEKGFWFNARKKKREEKLLASHEILHKEPEKLVDLFYIPINKSLRFFFRITEIRQEGFSDIKYDYEYIPYSRYKVIGPDKNFIITNKGTKGSLNDIVKAFYDWIELIKDYDQLKLTDAEIFLAENSKEFYDELKILDADAETKPFSTDQQVLLYKYLTFIEKEVHLLHQGNPAAQDVVNDINNLKNNIQNLTKSAAIKHLSNILAKAKKLGIKLLVEVYDVAKKEAIKAILKGSLDEIHHLLPHIF